MRQLSVVEQRAGGNRTAAEGFHHETEHGFRFLTCELWKEP
jgi:hypothetical protein